MPIVSGNEPRSPRKSNRPGLAWILPLVIFGPTIYNAIRRTAAGRITDQQLLIIGGGFVALIALLVIVQRVKGLRDRNTTSLPTSYQPPTSSTLPAMQPPAKIGDAYVPPTPRYEPIVTGKVLLAGVALALVLAGLGVVLLLML